MTSDFRLGFGSLLKIATPPRSVSVLLHRHPYGHVYYPLEIYAHDLPKARPDLIEDYFLYATQLEDTHLRPGAQELIAANSAADVLLRHGKLAVQLFEKQDLNVRFHIPDKEKQIVLAVIQSAGTKPSPPSDTLLRAAVHFARAWARSNEALLAPAGSNADAILESVRKTLADADPDPPFFPILHSCLACTTSAQLPEVRPDGAWGTNFLCYNCALWAKCDELRDEYIDEMFRLAQSQSVFPHPIPHSKDSLVKAVTQVCDDLVLKLATVPRTGATLCLRLNVPKEHTASTREMLEGHKEVEVDSDWDLLNLGINRLLARDKSSALVTMWLGRVDGDDVKYALPVGCAPGLQSHALSNIAAEYEDLETNTKLVQQSTNRRLSVSLVTPETLSTDSVEVLTRLVGVLINGAADRIETLETDFPAPFTLDFQFKDKRNIGDTIPPLLISCNANIPPIAIPYEEEPYRFFFLLASKKKERQGPLSHDELRQLVFSTRRRRRRDQKADEAESRAEKDKSGNDISSPNHSTEPPMDTKAVGNRVRDTWHAPFRKRGIRPPQVGTLVDNDPGQGWFLGEDVEVRGLTDDALSRARQSFAEWMTRPKASQ